jgi:hypothetical protein
METHSPPPLKMPSFLYGTYPAVHRKARATGRRCAASYLEHGSLPAPRELREVSPGEVVILKQVVDFRKEIAAWRLYMDSDVRESLHEALRWQDTFHVSDVYEASSRDTTWGALYYATSHIAPMDAGRVALRLEAVLRFWDSLQSARYLFSSPGTPLTLDELMAEACDWAMQAWCPEGGESVRACLAVAAERMGRATREDSIKAILRQLPRALPFARGLKHRDVLADPNLWRERLATLDPESFGRISAALTANLLQRLYLWDGELENN